MPEQSRLELLRDGTALAWTTLWLVKAYGGHRLVAIPRLRLDQETCLSLTQRIPYQRVFAGATVQLLEDPPREFVVVHASFDLYKTGEADISGFAILVPDLSLPLPPQELVIKLTAAMLRGE